MSLSPKISPKVGISEKLWGVLLRAARSTDCEISALGYVNQHEDKEFHVSDIFFPPQTNTLSTTSMDQEALGNIMREGLKEGESPATVKCWIHSHAKWEVYWSETDEACIKALLDSSEENWLVSIVLNHKGDYKVRLDITNPESLSGGLFGESDVISIPDISLTTYYTPPSTEEKAAWEAEYAAVATESAGMVTAGYMQGFASEWSPGVNKPKQRNWEQECGITPGAADADGMYWNGYDFEEEYTAPPALTSGFTESDLVAAEEAAITPNLITVGASGAEIVSTNKTPTTPPLIGGPTKLDDCSDLPYGDGILFCIDALDIADVCNMYRFVSPKDVHIINKAAYISGALEEDDIYEGVGDYLTGKRTLETIVRSFAPGFSAESLGEGVQEETDYQDALTRMRKNPRKPAISKKAWQGLLRTRVNYGTPISVRDCYVERMGAELGLLSMQDIVENHGLGQWWKRELPEYVVDDLWAIAPKDSRYKEIYKLLTDKRV